MSHSNSRIQFWLILISFICISFFFHVKHPAESDFIKFTYQTL